MLKQIAKDVYEKLLKNTRQPTGGEIEKIRDLINKKIVVLSLWDGKEQLEKGILKEVDRNTIYMPPLTIPFSGSYCGIISVSDGESIAYQAFVE